MSYLAELHLEREPFSTSPDPAFFYRSMEHYTALNRLEIAIRLKRGLSLVLGDVGTGKTTLSRTLLQSFVGEEDDYLFHLILDPTFNSEYQFVAYLARLFGLNIQESSLLEYKQAIERYLYEMGVQEHKTVVLIIDEGQKLDLSQLEILRTLLNYETNEFKLLQLVIFSQLELLDRIQNMKNFMDRISMKYILRPLDQYETKELIEFRLQQAGHVKQNHVFSNEAIRKIYEYTHGYPRQISRVCHNAMQRIAVSDNRTITGSLIDQIALQDELWN